MRLQVTIIAAVATLLSSVGLYPLFDGAGWFWPGVGAIISVAAAGLLVRRFRLHAVVNWLAALTALFLFLTIAYARDSALLGVVPTPGSLARLGELADEGWSASNRYAAPVPVIDGISFLAALSIGLVAALVDLLAVRMRRAAPAGLPLLAMYCAPAAVRDESISWAAFLLGSIGFLALLLVDARDNLSGWGRPVFTRRWSDEAPREQLSSTAMALTGRRIGLTAVVIAVLVPVAIPGVQTNGMFGAGGKTQRGTSKGGTLSTPDPLVNLQRQLTEQSADAVMSYRTTDSSPSPDYLRMYSLDRFDGDVWTYTKLRSRKEYEIGNKPLPSPEGLASARTRPVTTKIEVPDSVKGMKFLAAPYPPVRIKAKGRWRADPSTLMVYSTTDAAGGKSYTVESHRVVANPQQLRAIAAEPPPDVQNRYLATPREPLTQVRRLADRITSNAQTTHGKALALQEWFTTKGGFTYSLRALPPKDVDALRDFLFGSKTGYCEQFAASMALLARYAGIPSRVAVGYTAGSRETGSDRWVVRARDAHAWPELYFQGAGWLRFEPTPSGGAGQGSATTPGWASAINRPGPQPTTSTNSTQPSPGSTEAGPSAGANRPNRNNDPGSLGANPRSGSDSPVPVGWLLLLLALLIVAMAPVTGHWLAHRRRWARSASPEEAALAAWSQLRVDAIDYGFSWRGSDSPRMVVRRLSERLKPGDDSAGALARIAWAEERARYAPSPASPATLRGDTRLVRGALAGGVSRRARWRARVAPPSILATFRRAGGRCLEAFEWLDVLGSRTRRRRRRR